MATAAVIALTREPAALPCAEIGNATVQGDRCIASGNVLLERDVQRLPDQLTIKGNLTIRGTPMQALPAGLVVEGNLTLYKTSIATLPADLFVAGDFDTYAGFGSPVIHCGEIPTTVVIKGKRGCGN